MARPGNKNPFQWTEEGQSHFSLLIVVISEQGRLKTKGPIPMMLHFCQPRFQKVVSSVALAGKLAQCLFWICLIWNPDMEQYSTRKRKNGGRP